MHTGFISFCDRVCNNIKSLDTKELILNEVEGRFGIQILMRHWHRLDEKGIHHVRRIPHFACLRSNGNPYFMLFTKFEDTPIIYYIDKKVQPGYQTPRIIVGRGKWSEELSEGTLMDGEMVKDKNGRWVFLFNDLIAYKGKHLTGEPLPERMRLLRQLLETMYVPDSTLDVCTYMTKRYAHATQQGTHALMEWMKELPYSCRGIYYWPFSNKYKPKLFNFDETLIKLVAVKLKDNPQFRVDPVSPQKTVMVPSVPPVSVLSTPQPQSSCDDHVAPVGDGDIRMMWLRRTDMPDVFDVYPTDNGMLCNNKQGIAYVKTLDDSRMLRSAFKTATVAVYIPWSCKYGNAKWQPLNRILS